MPPFRRRRPLRGSLETREGRLGLLFVAPALVFLIALAIYPVLYAGWKSLYQTNLFNPSASTYYGLGNYRDLWNDDFFLHSIELTVIFAICVVVIELALGIGLALLLDQKMKGINLLRTLIVLPVFISPVGMGLTWRFMMDPAAGVMNWILHGVGLPGSLWLSSQRMALPSIMIADISAVDALRRHHRPCRDPKHLTGEWIEAARLDNVRGLRYLRKILIPLLAPVLVIVALIRLVDSIRLFDLTYVMTGGGPGSSTLVASVNDYSIFRAGNFGQTAALGFVILLLVDVLVVIFLQVLARQNRRVRRAGGA